MTLPDERYRAILNASLFLSQLSDPKGPYPGVPKKVRQEAWAILRHYPSDWDMSRTAKEVPDIFAEKMEPLYRMVKDHQQNTK